MTIKFLGIEIQRKTDILAFTAFLISLTGIIAQGIIFLRGPDVKLFPPHRLLICSKKYEEGKQFMTIAAQMVYVNRGHFGYNDIIKKETVSITIEDKTYILPWQHFVEYRHNSGTGKEKSKDKLVDGCKLLDIQKDASPFLVNARDVETHYTHFAAIPDLNEQDPNKNYLHWFDFMKAVNSKNEDLIFRFEFESYSGEKGSVSCKVVFDDIKKMIVEKHAEPICVEIK